MRCDNEIILGVPLTVVRRRSNSSRSSGSSNSSGAEARPDAESRDEAGADAARAEVSQASGQVAARAASELSHLLAKRHEPGLYLVATPIGNLGDISLRALAVLASADTVYAEDTRHSGRLLSHFGIVARLRPYHEHNAERERPVILAALGRGETVALISDAGTPLISDPGFKLVRACAEEGHLVTSLPGASAPLAALVTSGLPSDTFLFAGFLPSRQQARLVRIAELSDVPATLILFEAPSRIAETLADLAQGLGDRPAAVGRELTKLNEEMARDTLRGLAADFAGRDSVKGEIVIVIGPPVAVDISEGDVEARLSSALARMSLRDAAKAVADELGVPRKRAYEVGLRLQREASGAGEDDGER